MQHDLSTPGRDLASAVRASPSLLRAVLLIALTACRGPVPAAQPLVARPAAPLPAPPPPVAPTQPSSEPEPSITPSVSPPPITVRFRRELEIAVTALAVERAPFAAAVTRDAVWMHEASGWREEKLPSAARGVPFAVFYGRDNRVRLVSVRGVEDAAPGIYLRWKPDGLRAAPGELGKLATLPRSLVSVLGNDDPEIVCQPGDTCLVKRRSGWTFIEAPADLVHVTLGEGVGWAVAGQRLLRLGERWDAVGPPGTWRAADALFATRERAWIVETARDRVHAFDGTQWIEMTSPVERPRALWGARSDALWLAGDGGLAFFDGAAWRPVTGAPAPLAAVAGRGDDVWIGGEPGLFRIEPGAM